VRLYRRDGTGKWQPYLNRSADPTMAPLGLGTHTDSRGRFTEFGLPQGIYCVEIMLPEASSASDTITGHPSVTFRLTTGDALRVYNGDKFRLRDAAPLELTEGEDRSGIDITVPTHSLYSLHGVVLAKSDGHSIPRGEVRLLDPDDKTMLRQTSVDSEGAFAFNYVVKGPYLLQIERAADIRNGKAGTNYESMVAPLQVDQDISDLSYSLTTAKK
jgi:hypothetical protein